MEAQFFSTKTPEQWIQGEKHKHIMMGKEYLVMNVVYHKKIDRYEYIYK